MNRHILGIVFMALVATGCASIVSDSVYPVTFNSNPTGAVITITDDEGYRLYEGKTPTTISLDASSGFFSSAKYHIEATLDGHNMGRTTIKGKLDGWYLANFIFGGVIGLLIIDPATGAMWKLPSRSFVNLGAISETAQVNKGTSKLHIMTLEQLPDEHHAQLVRVN